MSAEAITASVVKHEVLFPAMEAVAISDRQRDLLLNDRTIAADSIIELLEEGAQVVIKGSAVVAELMRKVVELLGLEEVQLAYGQQIAGWSDSVGRHLRDAELNGQAVRALSGRKLADELKVLLDELGDPLGGAHATSRADLRSIFERYPREVLFRDAVLHHTGKQRSDRLLHEYERWERARDRKHGAR